jgi:heptosyltransferase-1
MRILVVRLSSLGDVVHAIPVAAALRRTFPDAEIDWLVDEYYRELVELVSVVDRVISIRIKGSPLWRLPFSVIRQLRASRYDIALDLQGLLKSALLARISGASRVVGFGLKQVREPLARWFYSETPNIGKPAHVITKNLELTSHLGVKLDTENFEFPINTLKTISSIDIRKLVGLKPDQVFALMNPGSGWTSKCWAPERFGMLARQLSDEQGFRSVISWGPGEDLRAQAVVSASSGAALLAPPTSIVELISLAREARIMISGDSGPLHVAAAVKTPVVGIYGPSDSSRNGPWSASDIVVSRKDDCLCRRLQLGTGGVVIRRCKQTRRCLDGISVDDVASAVARRLRSDSNI